MSFVGILDLTAAVYFNLFVRIAVVVGFIVAGHSVQWWQG